MEAEAYQEGLKITFSQYMQPESLGQDTLRVQINGRTIQGTVRPHNLEKGEDGSEYASSFFFETEEPLRDRVAILIQDVSNYAGKKMEAAFQEERQVQVLPFKLKGPETVRVEHHGTAEVRIAVLPQEAGAGKAIKLETASGALVQVKQNTVTADENGEAVFQITGELPG